MRQIHHLATKFRENLDKFREICSMLQFGKGIGYFIFGTENVLDQHSVRKQQNSELLK